MNKVNILLVDDNQTFLNAFNHLVVSVLGDTIGRLDYAYNGEEALNNIKSYAYHYVFMDVTMPNMNGIMATKRAIDEHKGFIIIAVSFHQEFEIMREMIEAGARYYVNKSDLTYDKLIRIFEIKPS
jgi:DNA-binding NarL/FixJ family response regulator